MTSMEEQTNCFYLDSELKPASDMLRQCVGDSNSPYRFNCEENPMKQVMPEEVKETARMNDIAIQRGFASYNINTIDNSNYYVKKNEPMKLNKLKGNTEGYMNYEDKFITDNGLGESQIPEGKCPEGYGKCPITGRCIQKCIGCIYRDNMRSQIFNKSDPCFPEGVYNGITNEGYIKCTCGNENKYCSEDFTKNIFTAEGMMKSGKKIILNTGLTNDINNLFNFGTL